MNGGWALCGHLLIAVGRVRGGLVSSGRARSRGVEAGEELALGGRDQVFWQRVGQLVAVQLELDQVVGERPLVQIQVAVFVAVGEAPHFG